MVGRHRHGPPSLLEVMRILFFSEQFWPESNAPAIHVYERARLWVKAGHEVTIVTSAPNFPEGVLFPGYRNQWRAVEFVEGIRVVRVKTYITANKGTIGRVLDYLSYMASALFFSCFEREPDVVISTSPQLFTAVAGVLYAKLFRRPHVFELRDLWPASILAVAALRPGLGIRLLERMELWLYRQSAHVLAFTEAFKEDLVRRGIPAGRIRVIPNGVDLSAFSPRDRDEVCSRELGLVQGQRVVAYFGTLGLAHGLDVVIAAMSQLKHEPLHLLLAGPGAEWDLLEARIQEAGLKNVTILPRQPRDRMPSLWSLADIALVSLRDTEVFRTVVPSKLYEAVAMGCPVLFVGPEGEASRLVVSGAFGICSEAGNAAALANALKGLADDPGMLDQLRRAALEARRGFSRETQVERCLELLDQVVGA